MLSTLPPFASEPPNSESASFTDPLTYQLTMFGGVGLESRKCRLPVHRRRPAQLIRQLKEKPKRLELTFLLVRHLAERLARSGRHPSGY